MTIIVHPLTAKNGSPEYTADDYRHAINPLLLPSDGTAFNGLSGIRYGSPSPLVTVSGLTVTVKPHCGTVSPWDGLGAYTYAITTNTTVQLADSTNGYKIAVTVEDPSQSHGTTPRGKIEVFTAGTPDSNINGLVIAEVNAGVVSDTAPMIGNSVILVARNLEQLNTIDAVDGQEAVTMADNTRYVRENSEWRNLSNIRLLDGQGINDWDVDYRCSRSGKIVSICLRVTRKNTSWKATAWGKSQILKFPDYLRPQINDVNIYGAGQSDSGFQLDPTGLYVRPFANLTYNIGAWSSAAFSYTIK